MEQIIAFALQLVSQLMRTFALMQKAPTLTKEEVLAEIERIKKQEAADDATEWSTLKDDTE
jgi:hypothetical protein